MALPGLRSWLLLAAGALAALPVTAAAQRGDIGVHDPVMIRDGDTYYLFSTGRGVPIRRSTNMIDWERAGAVFAGYPDELPPWAKDAVPGVTNIWAPDVSHFNGKFHVYYSLSTFVRNTSAIGLATNVTLDPDSPDYRWVDEGRVIQSVPSDRWNAIDANIVLDDDGTPWMSWGSFWTGIKLKRLDAATGHVTEADTVLYAIADRPVEDAIEAPRILRHGDFYYLFVSFDRCCRRDQSTYRIVVGRSRAVTGPYVDMYDVPLTAGGGTPVLSGYGRFRGTGHNGIFVEGDTQYLVHHFYDALDNGRSKLQIRPIAWSTDGWPFPGEPLSRPD